MPWLSRRGSMASNGSPKAPSRQLSFQQQQQTIEPYHISFVPAQIDGLCATSPMHNKQTPRQLLMDDLRILIQNARCLPRMARTLYSSKALQNSLGVTAGLRDMIIHYCLAVFQIFLITVSIPVFLLLPGIVFILSITACWAIGVALTWPLHGSRILTSSRDCLDTCEEFSEERWIFVNSMTCSHRAVQQQCNRLSRTFNRRITGVHNRSNGIIVDILECLLQRCLNVPMPCTTALTSQVRDACLSNSVRKVILIGHGTGGIHISIALDSLHADLPIDILSKLEIYTFGSAAPHLSNPSLRMETHDSNLNINGTSTNGDKYTRPNGNIASPVKTTLGSLGHRVEDRERVIPHIEHYALASDIFARCGVLDSVMNKLDTRFCGRVFVIDDSKLGALSGNIGGGFMFEEHYLDLLFPEDSRKVIQSGDAIDQIVEVDIATAEKREFTAQGVALPLKALNLTATREGVRNSTGSPEISPRGKKAINSLRQGHSSGRSVSGSSTFNSTSEKRRSWGTAGALGIDGVGKARAGAKEAEGRSVRQLSRMWRFANGGQPVGEGVPVCNGVGHGTSNGIGMV